MLLKLNDIDKIRVNFLLQQICLDMIFLRVDPELSGIFWIFDQQPFLTDVRFWIEVSSLCNCLLTKTFKMKYYWMEVYILKLLVVLINAFWVWSEFTLLIVIKIHMYTQLYETQNSFVNKKHRFVKLQMVEKL